MYNWYNDRRRNIVEVQPNKAHLALGERPEIINVTQNIDDLLLRAGATRIIQLHGTLSVDRCNAGCGYDDAVDMTDPPSLRQCPMCGAHLRPDVVWFGEMLPIMAWKKAEEACCACDLMLVVGTAAAVYPAAGLIRLAKATGSAIIVINPNPSEASSIADREITAKAGEALPQILATA